MCVRVFKTLILHHFTGLREEAAEEVGHRLHSLQTIGILTSRIMRLLTFLLDILRWTGELNSLVHLFSFSYRCRKQFFPRMCISLGWGTTIPKPVSHRARDHNISRPKIRPKKQTKPLTEPTNLNIEFCIDILFWSLLG